jgi:hypothetical protein
MSLMLVDIADALRGRIEASIADSHSQMEKGVTQEEYHQLVGGIRVMRKMLKLVREVTEIALKEDN